MNKQFISLNNLSLVVYLLMVIFVLSSCSRNDDDEQLLVVETGAASEISYSKATITCRVIDPIILETEDLIVGVLYSNEMKSKNDLVFETTTQVFFKQSKLTNGTYTTEIKSLTPKTKYYYRAYCQAKGQTYYGQVKSFQTDDFSITAVDMGLPSGTRWATCNVGALCPEEYGDYYAWGELEPKEEYSKATYLWLDDHYSDIAGTKYDVAYIKWGKEWKIPTREQFEELFGYSYNRWETLNGVYGRIFISELNGNSIFFPAAGRIEGIAVDGTGSNEKDGYYWSSTNHFNMSLSDYSYYLDLGAKNVVYAGKRWYGLPIRPVTH